MNNKEIEELLIENGYKIDPVFGFYSIPKKSLGYYFYITLKDILVGKIKWNTINMKDTKSLKSFDPHSFGLVTRLDKQQILLTQQRMLKNKIKQKALLGKGYKELPTEVEPQTPPTE